MSDYENDVDNLAEGEQADILVVDDDPMNIFVVKELLKMDSIPCAKAINGPIAIELVKKRMD